jgi:hypothetical protein
MLNLINSFFSKGLKEINLLNKLLYLTLSFTLFLGLYFGEDTSGGGTITDFYSTFPAVEDPLNFRDDINWHFPLHYYFAGFFYYIFGSQFYLKLFFVVITIFLPFVFYSCLKIKYESLNKNNIFLFSLILFLLPALRTSAIWPNSHLTATFFFLGSLYFFIKWEKQKILNRINLNLFLSLLLMALAVYTRQLYAIVYLYFVYIFFKKMDFKFFLITSTLIFVLAIPGFYLVLNWPKTLTLSFDPNLQNSILINASITSFYLVPFFLINFIFNKKISFINKYYIMTSLFSAISVLILSNYFNYNFRLGGGAFIKLSILIFNNLNLFYFTSFVGLLLIGILSKKKLSNIILFGLVIFGFSASIIPQKYFEPFILIISLLLLDTDYFKSFLKNKIKINLIFIYFTFYLLFAIVNDIYNFNSSI